MADESGWTILTLKEHLETINDERCRAHAEALRVAVATQEKATLAALLSASQAVDAALTASKEAVHKAEVASDKRFDGVNEFRGQLDDQAKLLIPRAEAVAQFNALQAQHEAFRLSYEEKHAAVQKIFDDKLSAAMATFIKITDALDNEIRVLRDAQNTVTGRANLTQQLSGYAVVIMAALIGFFFYHIH